MYTTYRIKVWMWHVSHRLQNAATRCSPLQHTATHCNTHITWWRPKWRCTRVSETHCNTMQSTATHCNALQHTATHTLPDDVKNGGARRLFKQFLRCFLYLRVETLFDMYVHIKKQKKKSNESCHVHAWLDSFILVIICAVFCTSELKPYSTCMYTSKNNTRSCVSLHSENGEPLNKNP